MSNFLPRRGTQQNKGGGDLWSSCFGVREKIDCHSSVKVPRQARAFVGLSSSLSHIHTMCVPYLQKRGVIHHPLWPLQLPIVIPSGSFAETWFRSKSIEWVKSSCQRHLHTTQSIKKYFQWADFFFTHCIVKIDNRITRGKTQRMQRMSECIGIL